MTEVILCKWWEPILASVSDFKRKYYHDWIQDGQILDGRIQVAAIIKFSQNEWVKCFVQMVAKNLASESEFERKN